MTLCETKLDKAITAGQTWETKPNKQSAKGSQMRIKGKIRRKTKRQKDRLTNEETGCKIGGTPD